MNMAKYAGITPFLWHHIFRSACMWVYVYTYTQTNTDTHMHCILYLFFLFWKASVMWYIQIFVDTTYTWYLCVSSSSQSQLAENTGCAYVANLSSIVIDKIILDVALCNCSTIWWDDDIWAEIISNPARSIPNSIIIVVMVLSLLLSSS